MSQLHLLPPKRPRAKPRVMVSVVDAGYQVLHAVCSRCGFDDWLGNPGDRVLRKVPCPKCNEVKS